MMAPEPERRWWHLIERKPRERKPRERKVITPHTKPRRLTRRKGKHAAARHRARQVVTLWPVLLIVLVQAVIFAWVLL